MIICAALKIEHPDGSIDFIAGVRHPFCYECSGDARWIDVFEGTITEGFLTHENKFLNRQDAYKHAVDCRQLTPALREFKRGIHETELYSEDLW